MRDRKIWEPSVGAGETHEEGSGQGSGKDTLEKLRQKTASWLACSAWRRSSCNAALIEFLC